MPAETVVENSNTLPFQVAGFESEGFVKTEPGVNVYYTLFGKGQTKVILLMGICTSGLAWKNQIEYFMQFPEYQVLVMDNRGCGRTKCQSGRLTTSSMAKDVLAVIRYLEWNCKVHLVGNSLGGMIAQELAVMSPSSIATLTLIATHAGGVNSYIPPWKAMLTLLKQLFAKHEKEQVRIVLETVFSKEYLSKPGCKEHLSIIDETREFPTIADFYIDSVLREFNGVFAKENPVGLLIQQMSAVLTHYVSSKRLYSLRRRFPILVMTGSNDLIIHPSHSIEIAKTLDAELKIFDGVGHALTEECLDQINGSLRLHFSRVQQL